MRKACQFCHFYLDSAGNATDEKWIQGVGGRVSHGVCNVHSKQWEECIDRTGDDEEIFQATAHFRPKPKP